jgi:thiol-disulfide isomerase/thioredoxin
MLLLSRAALLCAFLLPLWAQQSGFQTIPHAPSDSLRFTAPLAEFQAADLNGRTWGTLNLAGNVTLIDIWSTSCGPCRKEHPALQNFYSQIRPNSHVQMLTFALDPDPRKVRSYMAEKGYTFPVIVDAKLSERLFTQYGGIPKQFVIDREVRLSEPFQSWSLGRVFLEVERLAQVK